MMTAKEEACSIRVCVDCLMQLTNGECEYGDDTGERERTHLAGMAKQLGDHNVTLGWRFSEYPDDSCAHDGCECDQLGLSWSPCDGCGSTLGGDRYAATLWLPVAAAP
jgi:hypothetical protein